MYKDWKPKEPKDLRDLKNAAQRQIKVLIEKENLQYDQIVKMIEYYQSNGLLPNQQVYIADNSEIIAFLQYEYAGKNDNNKDIVNVISACVNKQKNKLDKLNIYTEGISAKYIEGQFMSGKESRISPFGGATIIRSYVSRIPDQIEYYYKYVNNGENYRITAITILDDNNYFIHYSKKCGKESVSCGSVTCTKGKIECASFDKREDFEAICQLYKTKDISRVSDKCRKHVVKSRSLI